MKPIIITTQHLKAELGWLAASFGLAFLLNLAAIIIYKTEWSELYTQILWVLALTVVIYALLTAIRIAYRLIRRIL
ncbi:MAG: hypothetical protein LBT35_03720 [Tannerella sp.]|jgi:HAMP domain-containing protein|nr:hypothetical protein [Tannerella sp.]